MILFSIINETCSSTSIRSSQIVIVMLLVVDCGKWGEKNNLIRSQGIPVNYIHKKTLIL